MEAVSEFFSGYGGVDVVSHQNVPQSGPHTEGSILALTAAWGALAHDALMRAKDLPTALIETETELRKMIEVITRGVDEWQPEDPRLAEAVERGDVEMFVNLVQGGRIAGKTHG